MEKIPEMPAREKYHKTYQANCSFQDRIPEFLITHLNRQAVLELKGIWQAGIMPIPEHATFETKYEAAYHNWQWMARCNMELIDEQLGKDGLDAYVRGEIDNLRHNNSVLDIAGVRFLDVIAPQIGFRTKAEQFLYMMQWMTPLTLNVTTRNSLQAKASPCKMIEIPGMLHSSCETNCRRILIGLAAEEFRIKLEFQSQGFGCRINLQPLPN